MGKQTSLAFDAPRGSRNDDDHDSAVTSAVQSRGNRQHDDGSTACEIHPVAAGAVDGRKTNGANQHTAPAEDSGQHVRNPSHCDEKEAVRLRAITRAPDPLPDVRATVSPTSTAATSTAVAPAGLPPSRLDCCSACFSDCEIAPRQREVFRKIDGTLLCRRCYAREKRR